MKKRCLHIPYQPVLSCSLGTLAALALSLGIPCTSLIAQDAMTKEELSNSHTITLIKTVEVYEFENLKVTTGEYVIEKGDNLYKVLKKRGLISKKADRAQLLRLVKNLNPDLKDFNSLSPGQTLNMPAVLPPKAVNQQEAIADAQNKPQAHASSTTETVKIYERKQNKQSPAKVLVIRHNEGQKAAEQKEDAAISKVPLPGNAQQTEAPSALQPGGEPHNISPSENLLNYPSGNSGQLELGPDGVVYRVVKVQKGDTLEKLLKREGMDRDLIYKHLLKITLKLNPEIKNANMIFVGAELKVPAAGAYLASANIDPDEVRQAALLASEGKAAKDRLSRTKQEAEIKTEKASTLAEAPKTEGKAAISSDKSDKNKSAVTSLPAASIKTAQNTIGYLFTSLGERFTAKGNVVLSAGPKTVNIDAAAFPIVELRSGINIIIDLESKLPNSTFATLRTHHPQYMLFRTAPKENLEDALDKLWPLCGYYRVYQKDRTYEGGTDIRLKLSADWIIWPTEESWNTGRPLVISKAKSGEKPAYLGWSAFLGNNGIKFIDIYKGNILPGPSVEDRNKNFPELSLDSNNPSASVVKIAKLFDVEANTNFQPVLKGKNASKQIIAPVYWEKGKSKVILHFGDLSKEDIKILRASGYKVIESQTSEDGLLKTVMGAFGVQARNEVVLKAPAGGPQISLTIKGLLFATKTRDYFLSNIQLPSGMGALSDKLTVLKFEAGNSADAADEKNTAAPPDELEPKQVIATPEQKIPAGS